MNDVAAKSAVSPADNDRLLHARMRVAARKDGWMMLQGERAASCSSCAAKSGCTVNALSNLVSQSPPQICVPMKSAANVGDDVVVSISGAQFLQLTAQAYLLPAAALVSVACLSATLGLSDIETAFLALPVFVLSFLPLRNSERAGRCLSTLNVETANRPASETRSATYEPSGLL